MDTCRVCDARLFAGATFCARCLTPIEASHEEVAGFMREVDAAGGRWQPAHTPGTPWRPDERHLVPPPPVVHSRVRASTLTFGLTGRLVLTALLLAFDLVSFLVYPWSAPVFVVVSVWFLKDTWRKARIIAPPNRPGSSKP